MFAKSLALLQQHFSRAIIAGNRPDLALPDIPAIPDIYPGSALGGLYTGLLAADTDWIFAIACDMPYPDSRLLRMLLELRCGYDAVVPKLDAVVPESPAGYEPLFALYHKTCLPVFEDALKHDRPSIHQLYPRLQVRYLNWHEMPTGWDRSLLNLNTPDDLKTILEDAK